MMTTYRRPKGWKSMEPPKAQELAPGEGGLLEDIVTMGGARRARRAKADKEMDTYLENQQKFEEVPEVSERHKEHR